MTISFSRNNLIYGINWLVIWLLGIIWNCVMHDLIQIHWIIWIRKQADIQFPLCVHYLDQFDSIIFRRWRGRFAHCRTRCTGTLFHIHTLVAPKCHVEVPKRNKRKYFTVCKKALKPHIPYTVWCLVELNNLNLILFILSNITASQAETNKSIVTR
jgi:hypothetical protein